MIFNRFILSAIALLASHLTVGVIGYLGARNYYLLQIEQIRTDAQSKIAVSSDRITAAYRDLNAWADSNFVIDNSVSMHNSEDNTSGNSGLSSTASTAGAVQRSECRCDGKNTAELRRLYQEQLIIARDCDITASYYNELIEFYRSISTP